MPSISSRILLVFTVLAFWSGSSVAQHWNDTELELPSGYVIVANEQTVDVLTQHRVRVLHSNSQTGLFDAYAIDDEHMLFRKQGDVGSEIYLVVPPAKQAEGPFTERELAARLNLSQGNIQWQEIKVTPEWVWYVFGTLLVVIAVIGIVLRFASSRQKYYQKEPGQREVHSGPMGTTRE